MTNSALGALGLDFLAPKMYMASLRWCPFVLNLQLRGLVVGLGLLSNLLVIYANSGYMPLKREYFEMIIRRRNWN